jgi:hypothetical protein
LSVPDGRTQKPVSLLKVILMNKSRLIAVVLLSLLALTRLHAGGFEADIPFEFHAGEKVLPPGTYSFTVNDSSRQVTVGRPGMRDVNLPVVTRLGLRASSGEGTLVFDKFNGIRSLSEVWIPSIDGFLVHSIPEAHVHEIVDVVPRGTRSPAAK